MATGDRESTLTIKAADLSSQPINVVREAIEKLIVQQQKLIESAKSGTASQADFGKSLADLGKAAGAATAQISAIEGYNGALEQLAARLNKVGDAEARRAVLAEKAETGSATKKELTELSRLEGEAGGSIAKLQEGVDKFRTKTVDPLKLQLERMGVTFENVADSLNMLRGAFEAATKQQIIGNEVDREFIELKNRAKAAATALAEAEAEAHAENARRSQQVIDMAKAERTAVLNTINERVKGEQTLQAAYAENERRDKQSQDRDNAAFAARNRAAREAEQTKFGKDGRGGEIDRSVAAAEQANTLSRVNVRKAAFEDALHDAQALAEAERHLQAEVSSAERAAYEERAAREKQIISMAEAERTAVLNTINERTTREKALEDARAAAYAQNIQREQALAEQRIKASEAAASLPGRMPLGESATPSPGFSSTAESISGIVAPAQAARETLAGLEAEITGLADRLTAGRRKVEDYRADLRTLGQSFEALRKQASLVDLYRSQEEATRRAELAMRQEVTSLAQLRDNIKSATVAEEGFDAKLRAAQKSARDSVVAFNEQNEALAKTRTQLDAAGISYLNIDNAIIRLEHSAREGKRVFNDLNPKTGGGGAGEFRFLGLRPYELQNLSYQVNDVFTQLASGTSISQTLAQQGGQIFQLFQKQIVNAFLALKQIPFALSGITVGLALATVGIFAFIRALDEAANRRSALAQMALSVDGATVSVERLMAAARGAEKLGADFSEASKGARELSNAGQGKRLEALLVVAAQLSRVFGKPFAEALKEVQAAFSGGYDAMSKFATEYDLLREGEDKHIRQLYDEGQAEKARAAALDLIRPRFEDAYKKGISPFSDALQKAKNDWTGFIRAIADSSAWDFLEKRLASLVKTLSLSDIPAFFNTINDILHGRADPLTGLPTGGATPTGQPAAPGAQTPGVIPNVGTFAGGTQGAGGARNIRNNNPVNLNFVGQQGATLETGVEKPRFAKFENMETGVSAALGQALLDQSKGLTTIEQLITKYTPPGKDGNAVEFVEKYIKEVSEALGVRRNEPVDLSERDKAVKYIIALAKHEGGVPDQGQVERGVDFRLQGGQPAANKQAIADREFQEERTKRLREQERDTMTEEQRRQDLAQREIESDRQIAAEAAKIAEEKKVGEISATKVAEAQAEARKALRDRENKDRLARELEVTSELNELRDRALNGDKTNLAARRQLVNDFYDKADKRIEEFAAKKRFPTAGGITLEQAQTLSQQGRQAEQDRVALDTAKEIVAKAVQERDEALKLVREQLAIAKPADIPALLQKQAEILRQSAPKVQDAITKSNQALDVVSRGPGGETQDVQAQRARNRLLEQQTTGTAESRATTQQGISLASQSVQSVAKERQDQIDAVISQIRSGGIKFDEALRTGLKLVQDTAPRLNQAIDEANRVLIAARDMPNVSEGTKAEINKIIARNNLERQKQNEDVERLITEGLKDDQERLTRVLDENKKEQEHLFRQAESGQISYVKMVEELAKLSRRNAPRIQAARDAVTSDTRSALQTPNLREGFRAELQDKQTSAETGGDTALAEAEQRKKTIADGLKQLDELRAGIRDVEREQQALEKQGLASVESSEAARRSAYAKTNEEAKKIIPTLTTQINLAEKLGQITPAAAQKARTALAEFGAETNYVSKFTEQLGKTIESSIENRASQAFDTIAQSLGNLITGFGSLKDVWSALGTAFGQFAAGVLKDLASMIIKAYLYAEISALLGLPTGSGTVLSSISSAIAPSKHSGGMVGDPSGVSRVVDLSVFRAARRMHNGGLLGLNADEVPTILQRGEEVLSKTDMRNRANGGGNSTNGGGTSVRNVLAVGDKEIAGAMNGAHGEKVILSVLQRNAPTVKKWVG